MELYTHKRQYHIQLTHKTLIIRVFEVARKDRLGKYFNLTERSITINIKRKINTCRFVCTFLIIIDSPLGLQPQMSVKSVLLNISYAFERKPGTVAMLQYNFFLCFAYTENYSVVCCCINRDHVLIN